MQIIQNVLSDQDFQNELIKRFFHPKSFFFRCLNHELESLLSGQYSNSEAYLVMGSLLDKLVASENKIEFLQGLSKFEGFAEYLRHLNEGVRQLRDADLDAERMKIKIEGLAQKLFQTALAAVNHPNSGAQLKRLLGLDNLDVPSHFELDDLSSQLKLEPPPHSQTEAEPAITLDEFPAWLNEETDLLLDFDAGKDASPKGGCETDFTDGGGSKTLGWRQPGSRPDKRTDVNSEPSSVVGVFQTQLSGRLDEVQRALTGNRRDAWKKCGKIFDDIAVIAMIYGFEAFELIAVKCQKVVAAVQENFDDYFEPGRTLLLEVRDELLALLSGDLDSIDQKTIRRLSEKLFPPHDRLREMIAAAKKKNKKSNDSGQDGGASPKPISPQPAPAKEILDFTLPGEEDDDLMTMIKEISEAERSRKEGGENEQAGQKENLSSFKQQAQPHFNMIESALKTLQAQPASSRALADLQAASKSLLGLSLNLNLLPLSYYPASVESLVRNIRLANAPISENERLLIEDLYNNVFSLSRLSEIQDRENRELLHLIQNLNSAMQLRTSGHPLDGFILSDSRAVASA